MNSNFLGVRLIPAFSMLLFTFLLFSSCQKDEQVQPSSYSKGVNSSMTAPSVYPGFGDYDGTGGGGGGGNDGNGIPLKEVPITGTTPPPYSPPQSGFDTGGNSGGSTGGTNHGGSGGGGGGGAISISPLPIDTIMQASFFKNKKVMCALTKLLNNNLYKKILNTFIGTNKPIDLTFKLATITESPGSITFGNAVPNPRTWNSRNVDVTINQSRVPSMSSIEVALTLLHEGLHAQIYQKLLLIHGPAKLNNLNFPGLFKLYQDYKGQGGVQHQYIAQNYITSLSTALRTFDNNKFELKYYEALAWDGLQESDSFRNLKQSDKTNIDNNKKLLLANRSKADCPN